MKKIIFFLFILSVTSTEIYSKIFIPKDIYFHVYRNGTKIGYHKISFSLKTNENKSNLINANVEIDFDVQFLGFSIYSYKHSNHEIWKIVPNETVSAVCHNCNNLNILEELSSVTDKNGSEMFCNIKKDLDGNMSHLVARGSHSSTSELSHIYTLPSSYWDHHLVTRNYSAKDLVIDKNNLVKEKIVFNSQDCSKINFTIKNLGKEKIYDGSLYASRYKLKGKESTGEDINIDIWYDDKGNWVKMIFIKDGSEIEYFLDKYHERK